ncbi:MAG: polysaccharide biosynthesis/export family protein, partial [Chitinophagaceae bacterium]|nr:polysaccharide biosynthesis/export family protein [Chitinophagaceae bacterium]
MSKLLIRFSCFVIFLFVVNNCFSQDILIGNDLREARVDRLSDADVLKYMEQLKSNGLSLDQAEQIALSKGFPASELAKLRQRIAELSSNKPNTQSKTDTKDNQTKGEVRNEVPTEKIFVNTKIFGSELFTNYVSMFQPDIKIATPVNYQLGPDDELQISVYGLQEASWNLTISPEGTIYIPNVGEIVVSGYTVEEARARIRSRMSSIYSSLRSGSSKLSINLGKIRSIRITVLGSYKPGTFTVSSLNTLFNALYISGGPAANGSYREIELLRNNQIERKVDLYKLLLTGSQEDNVRLQENDIIRIPVYKNRVEIAGEVKRPGIFEILPDETVDDLLKFASGFTDSAYKASIKVIQLTDNEKKVKDINQDAYDLYSPHTGDYFEVSKIL